MDRWAKAHRRRTGEWPTTVSGIIPETPSENWYRIHRALYEGWRGLLGGQTLAELLGKQSDGRSGPKLSRLHVKRILEWADAHYRRHRNWPNDRSGPIADATGETWRSVSMALHGGLRGLPGGSSLAQLLAAKRGARIFRHRPRLTVSQILAWADAHFRRTGTWPTADSGAIQGARGETWRAIDSALSSGFRGLRRGFSLAGLLARRRRVRNRSSLPQLTERLILAWAVAHHRRCGRWPTAATGPVEESPAETWKGITIALRFGYRGLPGRKTLAELLARTKQASLQQPCPHQRGLAATARSVEQTYAERVFRRRLPSAGFPEADTVG
jgi:hypothetical protein